MEIGIIFYPRKTEKDESYCLQKRRIKKKMLIVIHVLQPMFFLESKQNNEY
jgi:hypothetical protein